MKYKYSALDQSGKTLSGYIQAEGVGNARTEIRRKGLYVVDIKEIANRTERKTKLFSLGIRHKLPMQLARQLSSLLRGGVPLFQALMIIANQMTAPKEKEVVSYLRDQVKEGAPLSEALKYYPKIFDELFVYSVQAGERSGALDAILTYQADLLENRAVLRGKIKTALIYPIIMASVGGGVLLFLMTYVVPMVMKIFERMNQELPLSTRVLIGVAHFINNYLFICIIGIAIIVVILSQLMKKNQQYRVMWENFLLKLPLYNDLYIMILANHFARIMATLLRSGVAMVQSIMIASRAIKSSVVSDNVVKMAEMVQGGADLSAALRGTETFPPYVADMVAVGENTGNVEEMLAKVSDYYEMNVNQRLAAFTSMVEPVIILVMGVIVAFVLVSILLPLFDMNKILVK
jgi:general secretion pathway protein F